MNTIEPPNGEAIEYFDGKSHMLHVAYERSNVRWIDSVVTLLCHFRESAPQRGGVDFDEILIEFLKATRPVPEQSKA